MKFTKRITGIILSFAILVSTAVGCGNTQTVSVEQSSMPVSAASSTASSEQTAKEKVAMKVAALKGPTGLGVLKLMNDNDEKKAANDYQFTLAGSPDEIVSKISSGEIDVAAVPTNLAATLYNKTQGKVQLAALNTLGVLSIVTNGDTVTSLKDLKGKMVYSSGQGATPEYALNYILEQNGLKTGTDVTVEYKAEHAELAAMVIAGKAKIAVLPEPFVTQVMTKNPKVKLAVNLTDEWNKATENKSVLTMGCLIVRKEFAEKNKEAFNAFLDEYKASAEYTNANIDAAAALSEKYDIMPAAVAKKAIPNCNITYIDGSEMKEKVPDFLNILLKANPKSIGGKLPGDDFYYTK